MHLQLVHLMNFTHMYDKFQFQKMLNKIRKVSQTNRGIFKTFPTLNKELQVIHL